MSKIYQNPESTAWVVIGRRIHFQLAFFCEKGAVGVIETQQVGLSGLTGGRREVFVETSGYQVGRETDFR